MRNFPLIVMLSVFSLAFVSPLDSLNAQDSTLKKTDKEENKKSLSFSDLDFKIGVGGMYSPTANILEASLHNNIVITEKQSYVSPSLWLETNYTREKGISEKHPNIKPGIFVAAKVNSGDLSNLIDGFGVGGLLALKRKDKEVMNNSLNFGLGYGLKAIKTYADGIEEGKPLPDHFEEIVFTKKWTSGLLGMVSFRIYLGKDS